MTQTFLAETSFCERYGHIWRLTDQHGRYCCSSCKQIAYCPRCLVAIPHGMNTILCRKHKEEEAMNAKYKRPVPPDMLGTGQPQITTLRRSRYHAQDTEEPVTQPMPAKKRRFRLGRAGRIMLTTSIAAVIVLLLFQIFVIPAWNNMTNQWNYGPAHVTTLEANFGHGGESYVVAFCRPGYIIVSELPENYDGKPQLYTLNGPQGWMSAPIVLLTTSDVNHDGKLDLLVQLQDTPFVTVMYNNGKTFQSEVPGGR